MIPSYLDGDADIRIEDIDKINTCLFNLEKEIATYKPKETKQDYSIVSIHRELIPGEVLSFDPPVYETPVIAIIGGRSVYIGTLNRKGILNVAEFKGLDVSSQVSEIESKTWSDYKTDTNSNTYANRLNHSWHKTVDGFVKSFKVNVSKETYQIYSKYKCDGIKCSQYYGIYSVTFISGLYKNSRNPEGRDCTIEIRVEKVTEAWSVGSKDPTVDANEIAITATTYQPYSNCYIYSAPSSFKFLGAPRNEQEWNNWKATYGSRLVYRGYIKTTSSGIRYYYRTISQSSTEINILQSFDVKGRDAIYVDVDVPYRRA